MTDDAFHKVYSAPLETLLHITGDCFAVKRVYDKILPRSFKNEFFFL